jgi:hypothetical protein
VGEASRDREEETGGLSKSSRREGIEVDVDTADEAAAATDLASIVVPDMGRTCVCSDAPCGRPTRVVGNTRPVDILAERRAAVVL